MSSPLVDPLEERPRALAIVVAGLIGFLGGQIVALVAESIASSLAHYPGGVSALARAANPPWWSNAVGLVGLWCGFAAAIYYAYHEGHLRAWPHQWRPRVSDLGYVVVGVASQFVIDLLYAPFHFKSLNRPVNHLFKAAHGPGFLLVALMSTLIAPLFEEWLFRGALLRGIAEGTPRVPARTAVTLGVVGSAVLFGLAHGETLQFVGLALFGVVLALICHHTKRLVPSYLTHASFNATALIAVIASRAGH